MSVNDFPLPVRVWPAIIRAVSGRCPACGGGMFFKSYLHQVDRCSVCGESFRQIHADDGPAWLTIGIVGHIVVPMALFTETNFQWPLLLSMTVWPLTAFALTMTILPRALRGHRPQHEVKRSDRRPELFVDARDKFRPAKPCGDTAAR